MVTYTSTGYLWTIALRGKKNNFILIIHYKWTENLIWVGGLVEVAGMHLIPL